MLHDSGDPAVVHVSDLRPYFIDALKAAAENQQLKTNDAVIHYIGNLLTDYARSDRLFDQTADGLIRPPLVDLYRLALEAETAHDRHLLLQRMGDHALFVAGILPNCLERSLVDVDYYIAMGANAYGYLSGQERASMKIRALAKTFGHLAQRFCDFVDLLGEVVEKGRSYRESDLARLYDLWSKTKSKRLYGKLVQLGLAPQGPGALAH
jgi:hypothetical protein